MISLISFSEIFYFSPPATLNALDSDPSALYIIYLISIFSPLGSSIHSKSLQLKLGLFILTRLLFRHRLEIFLRSF
ncbi:hypothetical protein DFH28DRAFT_986252, partial [Melampsora americana]